jgi:hypothetical protein
MTHENHDKELWQTNSENAQLIYCKDCAALYCDHDAVDKYGNPLC